MPKSIFSYDDINVLYIEQLNCQKPKIFVKKKLRVLQQQIMTTYNQFLDFQPRLGC